MRSNTPREEHDNSSINENRKGEDTELGLSRSSSASIPASDPEKTDSENGDTPPPQLPNHADWDGPDDPANPHNWPMWDRAYHLSIPALFNFAVTFGTSVYTPSISHIMTDFHVSRTVALIGLSVYTFGLGFGPIFSAPLSERYGRKIVYLASSPIFMLFVLGAGFSKNIGSLIVCRFFAGVTGSPALAVGAGTAADVFPPRLRAVTTGVFLVAPFLGPAIGPVVGGFAAQYKGWKWSQWCIEFVTVAVFLLALPMRETYKPILLKRRNKKLGILSRTPSTTSAAKRTVVQNFVRPMHMLVTEPVVFFFSLYTAFAFGILFLLFAAIPYTFQRPPYSLSMSQTGLLFIAIGIGVILGSVTSITTDRLLYQKQVRLALAEGKLYAAPEHRLYAAMLGALGIPVGLFWFAWTAENGVHWAVPVVALVPFAWGNMCLFASAVLYMVDVYGPLNGASAVAANGIFRYTLGAVFPLFTVQMYSGMGIGWATSLLGFLSVAMVPIPWVFYKWGPAIRGRSQYPTAM